MAFTMSSQLGRTSHVGQYPRLPLVDMIVEPDIPGASSRYRRRRSGFRSFLRGVQRPMQREVKQLIYLDLVS